MKKRILFVTKNYFPSNTGSSVVMTNLIKELKQDSIYGVVTCANSFNDSDEIVNGKIVHKLFQFQFLFIPRLWFIIRRLIFKKMRKKVIQIIKEKNITHVVGVYPDLDFLELARSASHSSGVDFYAYLHDTLNEGLAHTSYKNFSKGIQSKIFETSHKIFVMSDGMRDLYKEKYKINTIPLLHSFSEKFEKKSFKTNSEKSIFWGGSIYSVNKETVKRIHQACLNMNYTLTLSAANNFKKLSKLGFNNKNIVILPFLSRQEYINKIGNQKALLLSIDWPDESVVHYDELRTIFPTKTVEYLISGRPILVHCPENYFLAKFFKKHKCGIVITTRDTKKISEQIELAFSDTEKMNKMIMNAYETSEIFKIKNVKSIFEKEISLN
tara:strand:+ start:1157 stop:2302 length:1146 start_codon:yes stop_codon:yes gene_type:complete